MHLTASRRKNIAGAVRIFFTNKWFKLEERSKLANSFNLDALLQKISIIDGAYFEMCRVKNPIRALKGSFLLLST